MKMKQDGSIRLLGNHRINKIGNFQSLILFRYFECHHITRIALLSIIISKLFINQPRYHLWSFDHLKIRFVLTCDWAEHRLQCRYNGSRLWSWSVQNIWMTLQWHHWAWQGQVSRICHPMAILRQKFNEWKPLHAAQKHQKQAKKEFEIIKRWHLSLVS